MRRIESLLLISLMLGIAVFSTLSLAPLTKAYSRAVIYISPMWSAATATNYVTVTVEIVDVTDLFTWSLSLSWNKLYLYTQRSWVSDLTSSGFLADYAASKSFDAPTEIRNVDSTLGFMDLACSLLGNVPGASGSGTLVTIQFRVEQGGGVSSGIQMYSINLVSSTSRSMPYDLVEIDVFALVKVAVAYGTPNSAADVDQSGGNINIIDLAHIARNYRYEALVVGKT